MALVLVVDDSEDVCDVVARLLQRGGHVAECHTSAESALAYLANQVPSLIVLDVMMPAMTGLDVLQAVRATPRLAAVPVIIYSALSDEKTRAAATRLGATGYVVKGGGWVDLHAEIQKHIPAPPADEPQGQ